MIHIAILLRPYLDLILDGTKVVECRMTVQQRAPFEMIEPGERIYLKQSAGPYRGVAIAEHVLCEGNVKRKRLAEIKRDYNHLICGDAAYWKNKRDSRFITLIWLRDVQPCDHGPAIPPSQGNAWIVLENELAWRRMREPLSAVRSPLSASAQPGTGPSKAESGRQTGDSRSSFSIEITPGNLRNNTLYVTKVIERFPSWTLGGPNRSGGRCGGRSGGRSGGAADPITLMLYDGPTVQTDIVAPRKLLRTRVWGKWFAKHGAKPGDRVVFTPVDEATFFVGLARQA